MSDSPYIRWTVHINDSIVPFDADPAIRSHEEALSRAEAVGSEQPDELVKVYGWAGDDVGDFTKAHLVAGFHEGRRVPDEDLVRD